MVSAKKMLLPPFSHQHGGRCTVICCVWNYLSAPSTWTQIIAFKNIISLWLFNCFSVYLLFFVALFYDKWSLSTGLDWFDLTKLNCLFWSLCLSKLWTPCAGTPGGHRPWTWNHLMRHQQSNYIHSCLDHNSLGHRNEGISCREAAEPDDLVCMSLYFDMQPFFFSFGGVKKHIMTSSLRTVMYIHSFNIFTKWSLCGNDISFFRSQPPAVSPLFLFTCLQETQQQSNKEPYGLNLAELPPEEDLLIYERCESVHI